MSAYEADTLSNLTSAEYEFFFCSDNVMISLRAIGSAFLNCSPMLCKRKIKISISDSVYEFSNSLIISNRKLEASDWKIKKCKKQLMIFFTLSLAESCSSDVSAFITF